jgi:hypothetical protein
VGGGGGQPGARWWRPQDIAFSTRGPMAVKNMNISVTSFMGVWVRINFDSISCHEFHFVFDLIVWLIFNQLLNDVWACFLILSIFSIFFFGEITICFYFFTKNIEWCTIFLKV